MKKILMTGHLGLVGRHLQPLLENLGFSILGYDLKNGSGDICDENSLSNAISQCVGVVHLAAVSRVIDGEQEPEKCWKTNALASETLLNIATKSFCRPWVIVVSSREVYGEQEIHPVKEDAIQIPINIYGKSKAYMEECAIKAARSGMNTAIVRLANVYGCVDDHRTRVLPAFCRNAVDGSPLRVDGFNNTFDFTHVTDAVAGIARMVEIIDNGDKLPPIHLLPGIGTSLKEAAEMAVKFAESNAIIHEAPSRNYDVSSFVGCPNLAYSLLGWKAQISPEEGIKKLVNAFKSKLERGSTFENN